MYISTNLKILMIGKLSKKEKKELLKIKPREHYIKLKNDTHRFLDEIYKNNFAPRNVIGSCSYLYKVLKPKSYSDFLKKYVEYTDGDDKKLLGRSLEDIVRLAESFEDKATRKYINDSSFPKMELSDYFDLLILHIIIETYDGQRAEEYYRELYEKLGYDISLPDEDDDAMMGIDFIIKGPETTHYIQVKPRTFATSTSSTWRDRRNHFLKENLIKEKYGDDSVLEFIFYEKGVGKDENDIMTYSINDEGKIRFRLSDVCEESGLTKYPSKRDFQNAFKLRSF